MTSRSPGGRPRNEGIDAAPLDAATELISVKGFSAVTIDEVARRAGTTKPAFYRRFTHIADMIPAIIAQRFGDLPEIDAGSLKGDLRVFQSFQAGIFNDTFIRGSMAGWLAHLAAHPEQAESFAQGFLGSRLDALETTLARACERGEISSRYRSAPVMDVLVGPFLMRALMPGLGEIDELTIEDTVNSALLLLRAEPDRHA